MFMKKFLDDDFIILLLYVNDIFIVGHNAGKIEKLKRGAQKGVQHEDFPGGHPS